MVSKKFIIKHPLGIHMKPSAFLINAIKELESAVTIVANQKRVDAKSLMMLIAACIKYGDEVEVICEGPEEDVAMERITTVIENNFESV